ncbi:MAG: ZIP family metal transporter [Candidatus Zixiibacteriota bacterium]|nr:MAG: ZIP family metal transporter [candidate division Zixibacteria bacterium]
MANVWLYTIGSVLLVSLVSFAGILFLAIDEKRLKKVLLFLVSFAAGALLGSAFLHLLPESVEHGLKPSVSIFILSGIFSFFVLEKIICWRHCHIPTSEDHPHPVGVMNLVGDGFHNLIDGMIIAGSYLVNPALGISTTMAVLLHEIPQEIGDFGILVHAGYSVRKALMFNFLSALTAAWGAILTLSVGLKTEAVSKFLVPFTIGGFVYIATADLIPELKKETNLKKSSLQLLFLLLGAGVMVLLLVFHGHPSHG